jgi:hypothetical protein
VRGVLVALAASRRLPDGLSYFSFDRFKRRVGEIVR